MPLGGAFESSRHARHRRPRTGGPHRRFHLRMGKFMDFGYFDIVRLAVFKPETDACRAMMSATGGDTKIQVDMSLCFFKIKSNGNRLPKSDRLPVRLYQF
jgi:hypothetical protein